MTGKTMDQMTGEGRGTQRARLLLKALERREEAVSQNTAGVLVELATLGRRGLAAPELARLAEAVVARPELWIPLADHDREGPAYRALHVDDHVGIYVVSWMPGHDTGFHDHDRSCGGVAVAQGSIREERPRLGRKPKRTDSEAGHSFHFDATEIHRMAVVADEPAVTVHAYSPPLRRVGRYTVEDNGQVRRCVESLRSD